MTIAHLSFLAMPPIFLCPRTSSSEEHPRLLQQSHHISQAVSPPSQQHCPKLSVPQRTTQSYTDTTRDLSQQIPAFQQQCSVPGPISTTKSSEFFAAFNASFDRRLTRLLELGAILPIRLGGSRILPKRKLVSPLWERIPQPCEKNN